MGPRPFSRGNYPIWTSSITSGARRRRLQWGHDLSAVETSTIAVRFASSFSLKPLQWGHDLSAVETYVYNNGGFTVSAAQGS